MRDEVKTQKSEEIKKKGEREGQREEEEKRDIESKS